jgi:hypothetical protein
MQQRRRAAAPSRDRDAAPTQPRQDDRVSADAEQDLTTADDQAARLAGRMWTLYEPIHVVTYFAPEARAAFEDAGLRGFWRGYFAGRAAPLGRVGPAPVTAVFFGFAPSMAARALPAVWDLLEPDAVLAVRRAGAIAALRSLLPDAADVVAAADALAAVAVSVEPGGRALGAANAALLAGEDPDGDPFGRLWQAATTLREHRGDGHVAALVIAGLTGPQSLVLRAGIDLDRAMVQPARGWTDEQWDDAAAGLVARGLLTPGGAATDAGRRLVRRIERFTDDAAASPWSAVPSAAAQVARLLPPMARACHRVLPEANPIGLPPVWDPADPAAPHDRFA